MQLIFILYFLLAIFTFLIHHIAVQPLETKLIPPSTDSTFSESHLPPSSSPDSHEKWDFQHSHTNKTSATPSSLKISEDDETFPLRCRVENFILRERFFYEKSSSPVRSPLANLQRRDAAEAQYEAGEEGVSFSASSSSSSSPGSSDSSSSSDSFSSSLSTSSCTPPSSSCLTPSTSSIPPSSSAKDTVATPRSSTHQLTNSNALIETESSRSEPLNPPSSPLSSHSLGPSPPPPSQRSDDSSHTTTSKPPQEKTPSLPHEISPLSREVHTSHKHSFTSSSSTFPKKKHQIEANEAIFEDFSPFEEDFIHFEDNLRGFAALIDLDVKSFPLLLPELAQEVCLIWQAATEQPWLKSLVFKAHYYMKSSKKTQHSDDLCMVLRIFGGFFFINAKKGNICIPCPASGLKSSLESLPEGGYEEEGGGNEEEKEVEDKEKTQRDKIKEKKKLEVKEEFKRENTLNDEAYVIADKEEMKGNLSPRRGGYPPIIFACVLRRFTEDSLFNAVKVRRFQEQKHIQAQQSLFESLYLLYSTAEAPPSLLKCPNLPPVLHSTLHRIYGLPSCPLGPLDCSSMRCYMQSLQPSFSYRSAPYPPSDSSLASFYTLYFKSPPVSPPLNSCGLIDEISRCAILDFEASSLYSRFIHYGTPIKKLSTHTHTHTQEERDSPQSLLSPLSFFCNMLVLDPLKKAYLRHEGSSLQLLDLVLEKALSTQDDPRIFSFFSRILYPLKATNLTASASSQNEIEEVPRQDYRLEAGREKSRSTISLPSLSFSSHVRHSSKYAAEERGAGGGGGGGVWCFPLLATSIPYSGVKRSLLRFLSDLFPSNKHYEKMYLEEVDSMKVGFSAKERAVEADKHTKSEKERAGELSTHTKSGFSGTLKPGEADARTKPEAGNGKKKRRRGWKAFSGLLRRKSNKEEGGEVSPANSYLDFIVGGYNLFHPNETLYGFLDCQPPFPEVYGIAGASIDTVCGRKLGDEEESLSKRVLGVEFDDSKVRLKYDFASLDAGTSVIAKSNHIKNIKGIQKSDRDSYMLVACKEDAWFVFSFTEEILIKEIVISSLEFYASPFEYIEISAGDRHTSTEWRQLAILKTNYSRRHELFDLQRVCRSKSETWCWAKFLKVQMLSYHDEGNYYCSLTQFSVFGSSGVEALQSQIIGPLEIPQYLQSFPDLPIPTVGMLSDSPSSQSTIQSPPSSSVSSSANTTSNASFFPPSSSQPSHFSPSSAASPASSNSTLTKLSTGGSIAISSPETHTWHSGIKFAYDPPRCKEILDLESIKTLFSKVSGSVFSPFEGEAGGYSLEDYLTSFTADEKLLKMLFSSNDDENAQSVLVSRGMCGSPLSSGETRELTTPTVQQEAIQQAQQNTLKYPPLPLPPGSGEFSFLSPPQRDSPPSPEGGGGMLENSSLFELQALAALATKDEASFSSFYRRAGEILRNISSSVEVGGGDGRGGVEAKASQSWKASEGGGGGDEDVVIGGAPNLSNASVLQDRLSISRGNSSYAGLASSSICVKLIEVLSKPTSTEENEGFKGSADETKGGHALLTLVNRMLSIEKKHTVLAESIDDLLLFRQSMERNLMNLERFNTVYKEAIHALLSRVLLFEESFLLFIYFMKSSEETDIKALFNQLLDDDILEADDSSKVLKLFISLKKKGIEQSLLRKEDSRKFSCPESSLLVYLTRFWNGAFSCQGSPQEVCSSTRSPGVNCELRHSSILKLIFRLDEFFLNLNVYMLLNNLHQKICHKNIFFFTNFPRNLVIFIEKHLPWLRESLPAEISVAESTFSSSGSYYEANWMKILLFFKKVSECFVIVVLWMDSRISHFFASFSMAAFIKAIGAIVEGLSLDRCLILGFFVIRAYSLLENAVKKLQRRRRRSTENSGEDAAQIYPHTSRQR